MIIHSPIISGSLTFAQGATFTLPDNGVYSGSFSGSITGIGDPTTFSASVDTRIDQLAIDTGSQDSRLDNLEGFTSSIDTTIKTKLNTETVVSGSSQVVGILSSLNTYTGSNDTTNTAQNNRLTSLEAETGSISTEQSSQDARLGSLEAATSSYQPNLSVSDTSTINLTLSSNTLSADAIGGLVSGSSQITYSGISSIPSGIVSGSAQITPLLPSGTVSGSSQVSFNSIVDKPTLVSGSAQIDITLTTGTLDISSRTNLAVSDTTNVDMILTGDTLSANLKGGVVSGSSQIDLTQTTNYSSGIKTRLDAEGVTSGSTHILALVSIDEDTMSSNSDTKLPTQQSVKTYVDTKVSGLVDSAPAALDTLNELAAALGDDANFATTISTTIGGKVSQSLEIISGNGLTGGGNLTTNRTLAVGAGDGISVAADSVAVDGTVLRTNGFGVVSGSAQIDITSTTGTLDISSRTNLAVSDTTNVDMILTGDTLSANLKGGVVSGSSQINHDSTTGFVADEHIDHTTVSITAGNGLTGGGTIAASRTINVVGTADRISVSADAVDIASTYVGQTSITTLGTIGTGTWQGSVIASAYLDGDTAHLTGTQTFSGAKTFSAVTTISNATASTTKTTGALVVTGGVGVSGALNVGGDVVAYASSDERLKNNIELISNPIEKVQQLKGVTWEWNENADELQQSLPNVGVIAQDVEKVLPQLVHDRDNGYKGVDYAKLTGLLIESIKEQQKQIDELKSKLG